MSYIAEIQLFSL